MFLSPQAGTASPARTRARTRTSSRTCARDGEVHRAVRTTCVCEKCSPSMWTCGSLVPPVHIDGKRFSHTRIHATKADNAYARAHLAQAEAGRRIVQRIELECARAVAVAEREARAERYAEAERARRAAADAAIADRIWDAAVRGLRGV